MFKPSTGREVDSVPGLMHQRTDSDQLEIVTVGTSQEQIEKWAKDNNATAVKVIPMNLEDTFIEYTQQTSSKKLFKWEKI